jgi:hypothetical protein
MKNRNTPLRSWASPSYGLNGRAASSFATPGSAATFDAGENVRPDAQISEATGRADSTTPSWTEVDARRSHTRGR